MNKTRHTGIASRIIYTMILTVASLLVLQPKQITAEPLGNICAKVHTCFVTSPMVDSSYKQKLVKGKTKFIADCTKGAQKKPTAVQGCYQKSNMNSTGPVPATCNALVQCIMPHIQSHVNNK